MQMFPQKLTLGRKILESLNIFFYVSLLTKGMTSYVLIQSFHRFFLLVPVDRVLVRKRLYPHTTPPSYNVFQNVFFGTRPWSSTQFFFFYVTNYYGSLKLSLVLIYERKSEKFYKSFKRGQTSEI